VISDSVTATSVARARVLTALQQLAASHSELADVLASLTAVVAEEAARNSDFGARLTEVLIGERAAKAAVTANDPRQTLVSAVSGRGTAKTRPKRARRALGPWDPYDVYAQVGEAGLREQLSQLELEQLRDIVAEHGMNTDGLAMRWTKADRVVGRIVDRVVDRSAKGDAFRGG
jgi:hypothetical protein